MTYFQERLSLFKSRSFCFFLVSAILANIGSGLGYITFSWINVHAQNPLSSVTTTMICYWSPGVIFGPLAGVLVDRSRAKQHVLSFSNFVRAIVLVAFGVYYLDHHSIIWVYVVSFVLGLFFSVYFPAVFRLVREIVPKSQLTNANATIDMVYEVGNVLGMACVGILIAWLGESGTIILNGLFFVCSGVMLLFIPALDQSTGGGQQSFASLLEDFCLAVRYINERRVLMVIYAVQTLVFLEYLTAPVLLVPYVNDVLHANAMQYGFIEAALSLGVILGGILLPWINRRYHTGIIVVILSVLLAFAYMVFSMNKTIVIAEVTYFLIGFGFAIWPLIVSTAQEYTALEFQGRVQSLFSSISGLMTLVLFLAIKFGGQYVSTPKLYWIEVFLTGLVLILMSSCFNAFKPDKGKHV